MEIIGCVKCEQSTLDSGRWRFSSAYFPEGGPKRFSIYFSLVEGPRALLLRWAFPSAACGYDVVHYISFVLKMKTPSIIGIPSILDPTPI